MPHFGGKYVHGIGLLGLHLGRCKLMISAPEFQMEEVYFLSTNAQRAASAYVTFPSE
jgi:hypothetical protein